MRQNRGTVAQTIPRERSQLHRSAAPLRANDGESVTAVRGAPVELSCSLGGTDCRFWRKRGTPCVVYGPTPHNIAAPDEYVEAEDLVTVAKAHALAMAKLLA
jgi:acetylornithine deacetylase/succinyl-diaminopimelate desuccinylase-like protein